MSDVKHTPGPWAFHLNKSDSLFVVRDKEKRVICEMSWHSQSREFYTLRAESEANARLIAAAPDMLESIQKLLDAADDSDGGMYGTLSTRFVRETVRAAIDRVTAPAVEGGA
ncbi:MAG: hypothetical protein LCH79_15430 [Proteobacteria bacterium]|nr:hypothetical protein [Pseudomonadota bacterium]